MMAEYRTVVVGFKEIETIFTCGTVLPFIGFSAFGFRLVSTVQQFSARIKKGRGYQLIDSLSGLTLQTLSWKVFVIFIARLLPATTATAAFIFIG
jgi:hypothetical protein